LVDIVLIRTHFIVHDSRLNKIFKSLNRKYSVLVLGWNRGDKVTEKMKSDNTMNTRYFNFKAPFGKQRLISYAYMLAYFSVFWTWVFAELVIYRPKVVHPFDLDTVLPCYIYKKIFRKKLVFEVVDRYAMNSIPKHFKLTYSLANYLEEFFSSKADLLITVGENLLSTFQRKPKYTAIIPNCPEDYKIHKNEINRSTFRIVFPNKAIDTIHGVEQMIAAIKDMKNTELHIAGYIMHETQSKQILTGPHVIYEGILKPEEALNLVLHSNVMMALYDPEIPHTDFYQPTKFYEAMMCGIPVITNVMPEFVNEIGFGIIVEYGNIDQIRSAITRLRDDPELRKRLGSNGRKAFLQKYNWGIMEKKLYDGYNHLM
jgi:glycosyltransferase involved in cell wall biosynthesis